MSQPTVSKAITSLEATLGVRLLERTTSHLAPTEEGRNFLARSKVVLETFEDAVAEARGQTRAVAGLLRINVPVGLGELRLNRVFMDFLESQADVQIEVLFNDRIVDLVEEGVDVAIRLGNSLPPNVIARNVAHSPRVLVASSSYIDRAAPIGEPSDLAEHVCLRFTGAGYGGNLELKRGERRIEVVMNGRYQVNSSVALRESLINGMGFGSAPAWLVQDLLNDGTLSRVLPEWDLPPQQIHVVYPSRRYLPERTRAFVGFVADRIRKLPGCVGRTPDMFVG